jgi:hypothetical protein
MNTEAFLKAYRQYRNGTDAFHFNPLYRKFLYSDGVKECAEAGCYWLLDILGTELPAEIIGKFHDDDEAPYTKQIDWTDMPEGTWEFYVVYEGAEFGYRCILLTEY